MSSSHPNSSSDNNRAGLFPNSKEHRDWDAATIRQGATLQTYLKSLDKQQLDQLLHEVLVELRGREIEQMKKDVLTHSKSLRSNDGRLNSP